MADRIFDPRSLEDFDGTTWGNVRLGEMTLGAFKRLYKTRRGQVIRPGAAIAETRSGAPWEIQVLAGEDKEDSRLTGFYVAFKDRNRRAGDFGRSLANETWYPARRFSDWNLRVYPRNGVAMMAVSDEDNRVPSALVTTEERLRRLVEGMSRDPTRIENLRASFDRLDPHITIGGTTVTLMTRDLKLRDEEVTLNVLRARLPSDIKSEYLQFGGRGKGHGTVSVFIGTSFVPGESGNRVTVNIQFNGANERGRVSVSSLGYFPLDTDRRRSEGKLESGILASYDQAIRSVRQQVESKIRGQKPPSLPDFRKDTFLMLIENATL